ncbi:MAG: VWA domain-containing protein, partial [Pseudomonadales bacterium]|nr:VWA domain-containing protein [Pseudomonadales bacterium]
LVYVTELEQHGQDVRIMLPTTISPRYVPPSMREFADPAELERINPPTVLGPVPYGLSLTLDYTAPQGVESVACPSHPAQVAIEDNHVRVELMGASIQLDRDFVLNIRLARPFEACAVLAHDHHGGHAVMINLYPDLKTHTRRASEYIFMVDRSGSMEGDSIRQALNALRLALRSLDDGDTFNIVGFGSTHEKLFAQSQAYSQSSLDEASRTLDGWDADLGGTELLTPLMEALQPGPGGLPRQIMLLTDGQVGNESACIAAAGAHAASTRIFTFGIGHGASEFLLRGLARACRGKAEFIHPNERIEPIVMRQFARAAAPYLSNVRMDWGSLRAELVAPRQIPSLFEGDRLSIYARLQDTPDRSPREVAVLADSPEGTLRFPVTVDFAAVDSATMVPTLMARSAIRELEEGRDDDMAQGSNQRKHKKNSVNEQVLALALRYQVLSSQTSFIAVEERAEGTQNERAQLRRVPIALTAEWGGSTGRLSLQSSSMAMLEEDILDMPMFCRRAAPDSVIAHALSWPAGSADDLLYSATHNGGSTSRLKRAMGSVSRIFACSSPPHEAFKPDAHAADWGSQEPADPFMRLTLAQQADGSFELAADTLEDFQLDAASLRSAADTLGGDATAHAAVHTAITLALLERYFVERRDEWQMLADKAARWLARQALAVPNGAASWVRWADGFL